MQSLSYGRSLFDEQKLSTREKIAQESKAGSQTFSEQVMQREEFELGGHEDHRGVHPQAERADGEEAGELDSPIAQAMLVKGQPQRQDVGDQGAHGKRNER